MQGSIGSISSFPVGQGIFVSLGTQYAPMVRKPGFLEDPDVRGPTIHGDSTTISLLPEAIIRGRVLITNAEPAEGMNVQLFMRQVQEGMPRWVPSLTTRTNSLGEFRFAELRPGTYKIMTSELMDTDPETTAPFSQPYGFPPVCFPGVPDFASGTTIQLMAGQRFQADIPLARQAYVPLSIPVANAESIQGMNVSVLAQAHPGPGYALGYNSGRHRIEGLLPPGSYLVEGHAYGPGQASGQVSIVVGTAAAEQPGLVLVPNLQIPVNVREDFTSSDWNGSASMSVDGRNYVLKGPRVYLNVSLEPVGEFSEQRAFLRPPTRPDDESLVLDNVSPGRYWVRINSGRGYVQSVSAGNVDLLHEPLVVTSGSQSPIEVVMRDDAAGVEGSVAGVSGATDQRGAGLSNELRGASGGSTAYIYFVPLADSSGQFSQLVAGEDGTFQSEQLAPGSYRVLAFSHLQPNLPYRDPQAMRAYEDQGQVVHLAAGQKEHLQLQLVPGE